jgi:ribosomal protein S24E
MEVAKKFRNDLFDRDEFVFIVEADSNPGFENAKKMVVRETKKPEENIDVYNVKSQFGSNKFSIGAYVYDSKENLDNAVQKTKKQRKAEDEAKKAEDEAKKAEDEKKGKDDGADEKSDTHDSNSDGEKKRDSAPVEEKKSDENSDKKSGEGSVEDRSEKEAKVVSNKKDGEEKAKE